MTLYYNNNPYDSEQAVKNAIVVSYEQEKQRANDNFVIKGKYVVDSDTIKFTKPYTVSEIENSPLLSPSYTLFLMSKIDGSVTEINSLNVKAEINSKIETLLSPSVDYYNVVNFDSEGGPILDSDSTAFTFTKADYHTEKDNDSDYGVNLTKVLKIKSQAQDDLVSVLVDSYEGNTDSDAIQSAISAVDAINNLTKTEILTNDETNLPYKKGITKYEYASYFADNINFFTTQTPINTSTQQTVTQTNASNSTVMYYGYISVKTPGWYTFVLKSDDAGYLWTGAEAVSGYTASNATAKHPGTHGISDTSFVPGEAYLKEGLTPIRIVQGNASGPGDLEVTFRLDNVPYSNINSLDANSKNKYLVYKQ